MRRRFLLWVARHYSMQGSLIEFGIAGTRVAFEYYEGMAGREVSGPIYEFSIAYNSTDPSVFTYTYYTTG